MTQELFSGEELCLINFKQLSSGHWAGWNSEAMWVTENQFEQGVSPDRFKFEMWRKATDSECAEDIFDADAAILLQEFDTQAWINEVAAFAAQMDEFLYDQ